MTRVHQVDAFTAEGLRGNPAGVVLLDGPCAETWLQAVAAEMNLAETAFVEPGTSPMPLRWFSPTVEIPLCGHATLATAHLLWEQGVLSPDEPAVFTSVSGELRADRDGDGIALDFPAYALDETVQPPAAILALAGGDVRGTALVDGLAGDRTWLLELASPAAVRAFQTNDAVLWDVHAGLIVTARSDADGADIVSRCFFPVAGIPEDPVTGAAHCALAPYWAPRLGRTELVGHQVSERGGRVGMRLDGDRVHLHGQAVTVSARDLLV